MAAEASKNKAADRVRRTLPFELHARIQSDARVELKRAMHEARERSRETGGGEDGRGDGRGDEDGGDEDGGDERDERGDRRPVSDAESSRGDRRPVSDDAANRDPRSGSAALFSSCRALRAVAEDVAARRRAPTALVDAIRTVARCAVVVFQTDAEMVAEKISAAEDTSAASNAEIFSACVLLADAAAAALFSPPPREAVSSPGTPLHVRSDASRDALWDALEMSCAATWRAAASTTSSEDARRALALRVARAVYAPERWIPALASFPEAPFAQRRAEATSRRLVKAAGFAASAEAAAALAEAVVAADDVGAVGVAVVLRAAVGLVEDAAERASQETHGRDEGVRDGDASVTSAAAARLAALCRDAGEGRTLRQVETATARVDRLSRAPVA